MKLYRIAKTKYVNDLTGMGARIGGGRWNKKGTALVYTSESISLSILEVLVHTSPGTIPDDLSILILKISKKASINKIEIGSLPDNWKQYPALLHLAELGSKWAVNNDSLLLRVPSVVAEGEFNILINPNHPEIKLVKIESIKPFSFDERLLKS